MNTTTAWQRILVTGAAGRLGSQLHGQLTDLAAQVRLTDIRPVTTHHAQEEARTADLADMSQVQSLVQDVDAIIHLGAVMVQAPWEQVLPANLIGTYNLYEAARQAGVRRIVYASSSHAIGMYRRTEVLQCDAPPRPDTPYGLSKGFGEMLGRMYFDKYGIETVSLRIGSCFPEPKNERMLATWLSHRDFVSLCRRCLEAPVVGYTTVYGMSNNSKAWWDNRQAAFLGYHPQDDGETFAQAMGARTARYDPQDPATLYQGGDYAFPPK